LRDGDHVMLNPSDTNVLAWLRHTKDGHAVVVACNFTAQPQSVGFDLRPYGVKGTKPVTLLKSPGEDDPSAFDKIALKPFGVMILAVH